MTNTGTVKPIHRQAFSDLIDEFNGVSVSAWNDCALAKFCNGYSQDAIMVTVAGVFRGREAIYHAYTEAYPDYSRMGTITAEVVDIRFPPDGIFVSMATAIIRCVITLEDEATEEGHSMVTFALDQAGDLYIVQDTSC